MADPVLHIKDGYYFDVPKALWRANYDSLDDVPPFLKVAHPHAKVEEFRHAMDGKILIPQPFGTLKNLHEANSGFCISKFMILELVVSAIIVFVFTHVARKIRNGEPIAGRFWSLVEVFLVFVREQVARPTLGAKDADRFVPLLWTIFFFILVSNLMGLVPFTGATTGAFGVTLTLAIVILCTTLGAGMKQFGPIGVWTNMVPHMELPFVFRWLKWFILVIEIVGLLIRHGVLSVRLLANMVAGHIVLLGILELIPESASSSTGSWATVTAISLVSSTLFSCLELFVAFLQAYIFTFLAALFIGSAIHHH